MGGEVIKCLNCVASVRVVANSIFRGAVQVFKGMKCSLIVAVRWTVVVFDITLPIPVAVTPSNDVVLLHQLISNAP